MTTEWYEAFGYFHAVYLYDRDLLEDETTPDYDGEYEDLLINAESLEDLPF